MHLQANLEELVKDLKDAKSNQAATDDLTKKVVQEHDLEENKLKEQEVGITFETNTQCRVLFED